jgi:starvation-inducible outer membrane lipoprotein
MKSNEGKIKMKKYILIVFVTVFGLALAGCVGTAPVELPKSPIVANWKAPLSTNVDKTQLGSKVGKATNKTYAFGLVSMGDMSVAKAARDAGIKTINHVDYSYKNSFLFFYQETSIIVYGD